MSNRCQSPTNSRSWVSNTNKLVGDNIFNYSFKKLDQVKVISHKAGSGALVINPTSTHN